MAPEQIQGDRVDARTNIFGLGVVLYETVTGISPFRDETMNEVLNERSARQPRPPREVHPDLSEQIEEIILHAMTPRPSDRYSSAAAMTGELDSPECIRVTGMYRNPRNASPWPKRLKLAGFIMGFAAVPFVLFYVFLLMFQRQMAR